MNVDSKITIVGISVKAVVFTVKVVLSSVIVVFVVVAVDVVDDVANVVVVVAVVVVAFKFFAVVFVVTEGQVTFGVCVTICESKIYFSKARHASTIGRK